MGGSGGGRAKGLKRIFSLLWKCHSQAFHPSRTNHSRQPPLPSHLTPLRILTFVFDKYMWELNDQSLSFVIYIIYIYFTLNLFFIMMATFMLFFIYLVIYFLEIFIENNFCCKNNK